MLVFFFFWGNDVFMATTGLKAAKVFEHHPTGYTVPYMPQVVT